MSTPYFSKRIWSISMFGNWEQYESTLDRALRQAAGIRFQAHRRRSRHERKTQTNDAAASEACERLHRGDRLLIGSIG